MNAASVGTVANVVITTTLMGMVLRQCRKPFWFPGRLFLWNMNARHAGVTNWGLSHVVVEKSFTVLDVGCGGGRTIATLASMAESGHVSGIDYSSQSVATSARTNATLIEAGRVDVQQGSVSQLPFPDRHFDLVTAVETHYYWPDLVADLREVQRVLKPGGHVCIIAETYKSMALDWLYRPAMMMLGATYLTADEHREKLRAAGYAEIEVFTERKKGWICAVARRPAT